MKRRDVLKGFAGIALGLTVPTTVAENADAAKRIYALDRTMFRDVRFDPRLTRISMQYLPPAYDDFPRTYEGLARALASLFGTPVLTQVEAEPPDRFTYSWTWEPPRAIGPRNAIRDPLGAFSPERGYL